MDISKWPMDQVMQLPDHCFGRRWPVGVGMSGTEVGPVYDISEAGLPERAVVWEIGSVIVQDAIAIHQSSLSLGDQLPTTDAEFDAMEVLFRDVGVIVAGRRVFAQISIAPAVKSALRMPIEATGRRLVGRFEQLSTGLTHFWSWLVVSQIPNEVPDCLLSV